MRLRRLLQITLILSFCCACLSSRNNRRRPTPLQPFACDPSALSSHVTVIAYGDQRFHDHFNFMIANPKARVALVTRSRRKSPTRFRCQAMFLSKAPIPTTTAVFRAETKPWRDAHLRVYPALGNHELSGGEQKGVEEWWNAFPELKGMRWYSVALGDRISLIQLDSTSDLTPGSKQIRVAPRTTDGPASSVDFVMISLHHPPVADIQTHLHVDHNPRPNEIALRDFLRRSARRCMRPSS